MTNTQLHTTSSSTHTHINPIKTRQPIRTIIFILATICCTCVSNVQAKSLAHEPTNSSVTHFAVVESTASPNATSPSAKTTIFYDNVRFQQERPVNNGTIKDSTGEWLANKLKISTVSKAAQGVFMVSRHKGSAASGQRRRPTGKRNHGLNAAVAHGLERMMDLYDVREPGMLRKGQLLDSKHPGAILAQFSAPSDDELVTQRERGAYAALETLKQLHKRYPAEFSATARHAPPRISLRRTPLESMCPSRSPPNCPATSRRYRTLDGTCNNARKQRWGSAQSPFHRFLAPAYADGVEQVRRSTVGDAPLASARFVSLLVHGTRDEDAAVTLMLAQWGQFIDHDVTATAQPRSINGSIPSCCDAEPEDFQHPSCLPIRVPADDPWLAPLNVRCLEFLRSAPALRSDCALTWREQTNQVTSFLDASTIYSSTQRGSETVRTFRDGRLHFGRGGGASDVCQRHAFSAKCIRSGDGRSGEQPGLLAMHHVWVAEHNRIAEQLANQNGHWSDEKLFQESRRIVGALVQHITYREFVPIVVGREVMRLFDLELLGEGYYRGYDVKTNPTVANAFSAAAFRFGHSLIQGTYQRCSVNHQFIGNNVSLHEENTHGDIGSAGSLDRLLRGMAVQRSQKRDEFITAELTNHLFQTGGFPFGLDLAAINIQRGRDHGLPSYTQWREPCGLSPVRDWSDLARVVGAESARRMEQGYRSVDDVDLFVAGLAERPVIGGLVGPTFACIIAQQFSNLRRGDRFWYENGDLESSFTPAQLQSLRQVSLASVLCRSLGGGTLQPHVFLPHDDEGNERRVCGSASLAPIDLSPWQERDPSFVKMDDVLHDPVHNKQESFELPRPGVRPNRVRPQKPLPGSSIVELKPTRPTSAVAFRPNREPLRPSPNVVALPPQEIPIFSRPPANIQHTSHSSTASFTSPHNLPSAPNQQHHQANVKPQQSIALDHISTLPPTTTTHLIVDRVDFIPNGDTGVHFIHTSPSSSSSPATNDIFTLHNTPTPTAPHQPTTPTRPIDNKLDFAEHKRRLTQLNRPQRLPVFALDTQLRHSDRNTIDALPTDNVQTTDLPDTITTDNKDTERLTNDSRLTIDTIRIPTDALPGRRRRNIDTDTPTTSPLTSTSTTMTPTPQPTDARSEKVGFRVFIHKPLPAAQTIRYPSGYRPQLSQPNRIPPNRPQSQSQTNVVIIQGSSTGPAQLEPFEPDYEVDYDDEPNTIRPSPYRPPYAPTNRPAFPPHASQSQTSFSGNRFEYQPGDRDNQFAVAYEQSVTTTETYSVYKPDNGLRDPQSPYYRPNHNAILAQNHHQPQYAPGPYGNGQYAGQYNSYDQSASFNRPPPQLHQVRPDAVQIGRPTNRPSHLSTPFSWDQRLRSEESGSDVTGKSSTTTTTTATPTDRTDPTHDIDRIDSIRAYEPNKLDFSTDHESPFSSVSNAPQRRPSSNAPLTVYVQHDEDHRPYEYVHADHSNDRITPPPPPPELPPQATTTLRPPYFPVLTNVVNNIQRLFGGVAGGGKELRGHDDNRPNDTTDSTVWTDISDANTTDYNRTVNSFDSADSMTDELPGQKTQVQFLTETPTTDNVTIINRTQMANDGQYKHDEHDEQNHDDSVSSAYANSTLQYDLDGYLRPEHMHLFAPDQRPSSASDSGNTAAVDGQSIRPLNWHELQSRTRADANVISIVPFEVLTRPERPDNWVIVDLRQPLQAPPMPPALRDSENAVREMPRPLQSFGG